MNINLSEEEIIRNIKEMIQYSDNTTYKLAMQGLLDLYNKELKKPRLLYNSSSDTFTSIKELDNNFIAKSKIKEKIDELYNDMINGKNDYETFYRKKYCYETLRELLK